MRKIRKAMALLLTLVMVMGMSLTTFAAKKVTATMLQWKMRRMRHYSMRRLLKQTETLQQAGHLLMLMLPMRF